MTVALRPDVEIAGAPAAHHAIEMEAVKARSGLSPALRGLSLHVPYGGVYGLVGPRGSGKSSTLRLLATLLPADSGTVRLDGIDLRAASRSARRLIGYLPDSSGVYGSLTVDEYLDFYGAIYRIPAGRRRRLNDELLELVDLTNERDSSVDALSRGMKQQLSLARCLVHDPPILLLDEPATGMDPRGRVELRDIIIELARLHKTIVISSHLLDELAAMCTHVGVLHAGRMLIEGAVDEVVAAVSPAAWLRVTVAAAEHGEAARAVLESQWCCRRIETLDPRTLLAEFSGSAGDRAPILTELVAAGVPVAEFSIERPGLSDAYRRLMDAGASA